MDDDANDDRHDDVNDHGKRREPIRTGVLALQGDFAAHAQKLEGLGAAVIDVREPAQLSGIDGLVIPGGESSTLLRLMDYEPAWWDALRSFRRAGRAILGTCAGLILIAREVVGPPQRSLGFVDVVVERNASGRQVDSFEATGIWSDGRPLEMVFIRAPRIASVGPGAEIVASLEGQAVAVRAGSVIGAAFHPELTADSSMHAAFVAACERAGREATTRRAR